VLNKVILPALLSPVVAALIAMTVTFLALRVITRAEPGLARRGFKRAQTVSASMVALAHGTNDAQKTMGVITLTLITSGLLAPRLGPAVLVVLSAGLAIALGTYYGRLADHPDTRQAGSATSNPCRGFTAETTSAAVILTASHLGLPLSTTQVCTGSIFGVSAGRRLASVNWGVAGRIVLAWSFTLPSAAVVGAAASWLAATGTTGVLVVALSGVALASGIYLASAAAPSPRTTSPRFRSRLRNTSPSDEEGMRRAHRLGDVARHRDRGGRCGPRRRPAARVRARGALDEDATPRRRHRTTPRRRSPGLPSAWPSPCSACSPPASSSATACTSSSPESGHVNADRRQGLR
jgi:hypothetical protein